MSSITKAVFQLLISLTTVRAFFDDGAVEVGAGDTDVRMRSVRNGVAGRAFPVAGLKLGTVGKSVAFIGAYGQVETFVDGGEEVTQFSRYEYDEKNGEERLTLFVNTAKAGVVAEAGPNKNLRATLFMTAAVEAPEDAQFADVRLVVQNGTPKEAEALAKLVAKHFGGEARALSSSGREAKRHARPKRK